MEFDVEAFYYALDRKRRERRTSWSKIAEEIEVSPETVTRVGMGLPPSMKTFLRLMEWLGETDLMPFVKTRPSDT